MFVLVARDKPGALSLRQETRAAHVDYLKQTGVVVQAGPILDADGAMAGSIVVLDLADRSEAERWAAADPYAVAGLFESVELLHWNKVVG